MCSISHNLKAIYFHIPKVGGLYIEKILEKYYDFETYYITADNHADYLQDINIIYCINEFKGFLNIRNKGIYRYFINSKNFNYVSNMNIDKWKSYKKFTFVRNPYDRCLSAYKYLMLDKRNILLKDALLENFILNNYDYVHLNITQYDHLVNNEDKIDFDYIGKFENLNEELINILMKLGIYELKHIYYIENNIKINSSEQNEKKFLNNHKKLINNLNKEEILMKKENILNDEVLIIINKLFENDFIYFGYIKYNYVNEYYLNKDKNDIHESNKNILKKYNFLKKITHIDINNIEDKIYNNRPLKADIINDIKNNVFKLKNN